MAFLMHLDLVHQWEHSTFVGQREGTILLFCREMYFISAIIFPLSTPLDLSMCKMAQAGL